MNDSRAKLGIRHRVLRNALRWKARSGLKESPSDTQLNPGEMRLRSFYTPGLQPGNYKISAKQNVSVENEGPILLESDASFNIPYPSMSPLDLNLVHSIFPPPGISAPNHILPHIVFNDPHLPWQKMLKTNASTLEKHELQMLNAKDRRIPWLAVIAFEQDEVVLVESDGGPYRSGPAFPDSDVTGKDKVNYLLMEKQLFRDLFTDPDGTINLTRYGYFAHVREVNIEHMTDLRNDFAEDLDSGTFSVLFSHRTGPFLGKDAPVKPCVVHVVALDSVVDPFNDDEPERFRVVTLFSWTYDCLPPATITFKDTMKAVGENSGPLRAPKEILDLQSHDSPFRKRLEEGYTLVRYRVQTGEETVALMRGPFTPLGVTNEERWFNVQSNSGEDLQIIDNSLGIIDISYCAAWQIGKALAIADQAFSAALLRIRGYLHNSASEARKRTKMTQRYKDSSSDEVIDRLKSTLDAIATFEWKSGRAIKRYSRLQLVQTRYLQIVEDNDIDRSKDLKLLGPHLNGLTAANDESPSHYTELKDPQSTDWKLVLNWLMDRIYLEGVPPYYLICDPTWLPSESIRFFYVDRKWLSALIDGALSICNHLDEGDATRESIKDQLRHYIEHDFHSDVDYSPQLPRYGCYMRSVAVSTFPDMVLRAPLSSEDDKRAEVLRQENVGKGIILCLFDRSPTDEGKDKLKEVIFSQPPHQQCFTFCNDSLRLEKLIVDVMKVYSEAGPLDKMEEFPFTPDKEFNNPPSKCKVYDWSSRTIDVLGLATLITDTLQRDPNPDLYKGPANAALIGIQLNDPIYKLKFIADPPSSSDQDVFRLPDVSRELSSLPGESLDLPASLYDVDSFASVEGLETAVLSGSLSVLKTMFDGSCSTAGFTYNPYRQKLVYDKNGTDVVFNLKRKKTWDSKLDITGVKLTVPLDLFVTPPSVHDTRMLRNIRFLPVIEVDGHNVIVKLIPKTGNRRTELNDNDNLSFIIIGAQLKPKATRLNIKVTESYYECEDIDSNFVAMVVVPR